MPSPSLHCSAAMRHRRRALRVAVAFAAFFPSAAQASGAKLDPSGGYAIRWWTVEDGVASMPLVGLAVAADDAVWCVSRCHLMRFDGRRFHVLPEAVTAELCSQIGDLRTIRIAPDGRLWVVGVKGAAVTQPTAAIDRSAPADWAVYSHTGHNFWGVAFHPSGRPLFYGMNMLVDFDGTGFSSRAVPNLKPPSFYCALFDRHSSDLWLFGYGRARRIRDGETRADDGPVAGRITNLAEGPSGIWAGLVALPSLTVEGAAVFRDEQWHEYPMPTKPGTAAREGHVREGPDGTVWLTTHGAVHALRDGTWQTVLEGLPDFPLTTQALATDRRGNLWAACTGGLLSISRTSLAVAPLPPCGVVSTRRDGSLVAGVAGAVVRLVPPAADQADSSWQHDVIANVPAGVAPTAIAETQDGELFVGTRDTFIHVVRSGSSRMVTQRKDVVLEVRNVTAMACDSAGSIWAGTANGLARYNPQTDSFNFIDAFTKPTPLPVLGLLAEPDGSLLVAVQGRGIERLAADGSTTQEVPASLMPGKRIVRFLRTPDGTLWAAGDAGLLRRGAEGQTTLFDMRHGLADRAIVQLAADDAERLWLAFRDGHLQGIRTADLDALVVGRRSVVRGIVLGPLDGLGDAELLGGLASVPGHGLIATTSAGIVMVDPARLAAADAARGADGIAIDHAAVDGQSRFRWADVTTHEFDPPLYQTRLAGVDTDWSLPASDTERAYASIPPGRRRFEVRHLRGDAIEDAPSGTVEIMIPAPFWQTPWFVATVAAGVAGVAAAGSTALSRSLARRRVAQLEREQELHRDRARIARDIHDSLGAGLAHMAMMSDLMRGSPRGEARADADLPRLDEALDDMYRSAQSLTRAVDEIVWAVNPANDTLPRLFTFLAHDAEDMARGGGLELQIHADDDLPDIMLPASTRHHLCMLVREAVANVLKHARAGVLDVSLRYHAGTVDVVIADDGVGFDHAMPARDGHDGLANMQARMDELGGTLSIDSAPGRGTRVAVHVPLKAPAPLPSAKPRLRLRTADDPDHDARRTG